MRMLTRKRSNCLIPRHHASTMKDFQPNRRIAKTRSNCIGVAYAVSHIHRRKKQCIASTVTEKKLHEKIKLFHEQMIRNQKTSHSSFV